MTARSKQSPWRRYMFYAGTPSTETLQRLQKQRPFQSVRAEIGEVASREVPRTIWRSRNDSTATSKTIKKEWYCFNIKEIQRPDAERKRQCSHQTSDWQYVSRNIAINPTCYGLFWSLQTTGGAHCASPGQNLVGLGFCSKNWYTYSLLCYKYTEKFFFWKKSIFGLWRHVLGQQLAKNGEKSQKTALFFKFISFHVYKRFWSNLFCKW